MATKKYRTPGEALRYFLFVFGPFGNRMFYTVRVTDGYGQFFIFVTDVKDTQLGTLYLVDLAEGFIERREMFDGIAYEQEQEENTEEDVNNICGFPLSINERVYKTWLKAIVKESHFGTDDDIRFGRTLSWKNGIMSAVHHRFVFMPTPYEREQFTLPRNDPPRVVYGYEQREVSFYWDELTTYADSIYAVEGFSHRYFEILNIAAKNFG